MSNSWCSNERITKFNKWSPAHEYYLDGHCGQGITANLIAGFPFLLLINQDSTLGAEVPYFLHANRYDAQIFH